MNTIVKQQAIERANFIRLSTDFPSFNQDTPIEDFDEALDIVIEYDNPSETERRENLILYKYLEDNIF